MKEKRINIPYSSTEIPTLIENKTLFEDVEYVDVQDGNPEIMDAFKIEYNTNDTYGVAFAYDTIIIIDRLFTEIYERNREKPMAEELVTALLNMKDHKGIVGSVIVSPEGSIKSKAAIKKIKNGKVITVE